MYGLKDTRNKIIGATTILPIETTDYILFDNCQYDKSFGLTVIENLPEYVTPQKYTELNGVYTLIPDETKIELESLKENQLVLMDVLATIYEGMILKGTV